MSESRLDLRPFWQKRRFYLSLAGLALVNLVIYGAVTYRLATKQERLTRDQVTLTSEIASRQGALAALQAEQERIARNDTVAAEFWSDVVKTRTPGLTEAVGEIDRLARQTGVTRGRTSYSQDLLEVGLQEVTVRMPLEGSYFNLVRFINLLERSARFFLVREIALRDSEGGELQLSCDVSFFLRPTEAPPAKEP
jgi:hypothetical protein